jgi:hypothetical protein
VEKLKLISDGGDSGSKKYKRGYGGAYGGSGGIRFSNHAVGFVSVIIFLLSVRFEKIMLQ